VVPLTSLRIRDPAVRAAVWIAASALAPAAALAQVSPGPLSSAHAAFDDAKRCFDCHAPGPRGGALDEGCTGCHTEIAARLAAGAGFHGRNAAAECARCHPEHGGREFELIEWPGGSATAFDHALTGWPLTGRHAPVRCESCHRPDRLRDPPATRAGARDPRRTWLGLDTACASCHPDPHRGSFGDECVECHSTRAWSPVRDFRHDRTAWPLTGKHVSVACAKCHPAIDPAAAPGATPTSRWKPVPHAECAPCHRDVHQGRFGAACSSCHETADFRILREASFEHARTGWPLLGRHARVACERCHDPRTAGSRRPAHARCADCHRDPHAGRATLRGEAADCASCHDERGFAPATYAVADHAGARFPLTGRHATVACAACHRPAPTSAIRSERDRAGVVLRPAFARCADCHADAHGGQFAHRPGGGECASCHRTDAWVPSTYGATEHAATGLALDGRHAALPCRACHARDRAGLPALPPDAARGSARLALATLAPECASCHRDPHEGSLRGPSAKAGGPAACGDCHGATSFRPSTVDARVHASFRYPLDGAHRTVPCVRCHAGLGAAAASDGSRPAVTFRTAHDRCEACHETPHGAQFAARRGGGACDACHDLDAFAPASRFDHTSSVWPLPGRHTEVACAKCHPRGTDVDGAERTMFRPTPTACRDCHAAGRAGEGGRGAR